MALTITDVGSATGTTSTATLVTGSTITASVGDWLVAFVAADNNGASGAASLTGVQDSQGNIWTQRALINRDPGVAAAGCTLGIFSCQVTNTLSSDTVTANFSPNTTAKVMWVQRVQPGAGEAVQFVAADTTGVSGSGTGASTTSVSVTNGDTILGGIAIEQDDTVGGSPLVGDSDTTNGSWSTLTKVAANTGSNATSIVGGSQYKTVNVTGAQVWDTDFQSAIDFATTYLILGPIATGKASAPVAIPPSFQHMLVR